MAFSDHRSMMAEYPTTPAEAFSSTVSNVFSSEDVEALREGCRVKAERGEVVMSDCGDTALCVAPRFVPSVDGKCELWRYPRPGGDYIVCVDIGGRTRNADFSVICVLDRHSDSPDGVPEIVAQWRGHIDHDLLARKAEALGRYYGDALLVVESNSWESSSEGEGRYILDTLSARYPNLYFRPCSHDGAAQTVGFHTNMRTKPAIIANLVACVRDRGYVEHSSAACDELLQYEALPDGSYCASRGCHDDMLMTRAIALYIHATGRLVSPFRFDDSTLNAILDRCMR